MVKTMIKERRSYPRAQRILSIEYRLCKSNRQNDDQEWHLSTTEDVSAEGLSFYSDYEYRPGDVLEVRVVMSGLLDVFKGRGAVARVEQKRTGACFFIALRFAGQSTRDIPAGRSRRTAKKSYSSTKRI